MAIDLKVPGWFGGKSDPGIDTQALSDANAPTGGRESQAGATIMQELRRATRAAGQPTHLPVIGAMPIAQQFKVLAIALVTFFLLAA